MTPPAKPEQDPYHGQREPKDGEATKTMTRAVPRAVDDPGKDRWETTAEEKAKVNTEGADAW